ncbi:MAG: FimB/Mfa2 family fimbrial subunit [Bacteroidales bacterium]|nr:FimB/Mfa2 family fimbrial subunit [Bacteroidales bacterium]
MKVNSLRHLFIICPLMLASGMCFTGCDSLFFDDEGDCTVHYKVPVTFTENFDGGDAVNQQVREVTLYVMDSNGNVVKTQSATVPAASTAGFAMDVDVAPGTYDLLVWGSGESPVQNPTAYAIGGGDAPATASQITATLPLSGNEGALYCERDITPLFHGLSNGVEFPDTYGDVTVSAVNLTRDTHVFQVVLQSIDNNVIDPSEISVSIEAANSELSYTNAVTSTTQFSYRPWQVTATSASFDNPEAAPARADGEANGLMAELTTGRLMADRNVKLVVHRNSDNTDVIRINLIDYLLMVKGEYNRLITDQQYLDRMRTFTLMFFLDGDRNWYTAGGVFINGWRIVPPQQGSL